MNRNDVRNMGVLVGVIGMVAFGVPCLATYACAATEAAGAPPLNSPPNAKPARTILAQAATGASSAKIQELEAEIAAERKRTDELAAELEQLQSQARKQPTATPSPGVGLGNEIQIGRGKERTPGVTTGLTPADIYNSGFFVRTEHHDFSLYVNGLVQTRFTAFKPNSVGQFGSDNRYQNTFDLYLGRLALSGSIFEPDLKYFFQMQGSTAGNSNGLAMLDWFVSKAINPYLTVQAGRSWIPYTYEYYDNPGNYLFPDLSSAEYAFLLQRAIGFQAYGQVGRLGYGAGVFNSIPALDAGGQESINGRLAYVGNLHYDVLAPYGWVESDPSPKPVEKPELTVWASGMYNPVDYSSGFENELSGDRTYGATTNINFRYNYLSFQGAGYYRRTLQTTDAPSYDSWGYGEQAGYYVVPAKWELAERISGVWWGEGEIPATGGNQIVWFDGPTNFPYHRITEYSLGVNYYMYGHHAKTQAAYSYLAGEGFPHDSGFGANRLWIQIQLMF